MIHKKENLLDIFIIFLKLGAFSFGGGYAMISLIENEIVENRKWMDKEKIVDIFSIAESLPGAIALNTSALVGYSIKGIPGAIIAILGNVLPSIFIMLTMTILLTLVKDNYIFLKIFYGVRPAIIGLICYAGYKIGKTAIKDYFGIILAILAFSFSIFINTKPIPLIVFGAIAGSLMKTYKKKLHYRK